MSERRRRSVQPWQLVCAAAVTCMVVLPALAAWYTMRTKKRGG